MKTFRLLLAALILAPSVVSAADDGGRPGSFLDFAASVRSLGMGQAFTAIANDPSAIYWNPSGVAQLQRKSLVAQFSTLTEGANSNFIGYAHPMANKIGLGVGIVNLQSGSITRRDDTGLNTGSYDATSNALFLSGSIAARPNFSVGSTVKVVREAVDGDSATAFGLDTGALFRANRYLQLGLMIRNAIAPSVKLDKDADRYPRSFVAGFGVTPVKALTLGLDLEQQQGYGVRAKIGADYLISNILSIRTGVNDSEFTAGLGIGLGNWNLDYAMGLARAASDVSEIGSFHRFGLQFNFGAPVSALALSAPASVPTTRQSRSAVQKPAKRARTTAGATAAGAAAAGAATPRQPAALRSRTDKNQPAIDDLNELGDRMDVWDGVPTEEDQKLVDAVSKHLKKGRYLRPEELYAAQGYVSYFTGEYARSVRSLENALKADPNDEKIPARLKRVQVLNVKPVDKKKETPEIRAVRQKYEARDYSGTILLAQRLLETSPKNVEANDYLKKSLDRLVQPYLRQAKDLMDHDRFVESFVLFQKTLDYDPDNAEAQAYSARLVKIIEKKSDLDYLARGAPRAAPGMSQGIAQYQKGLRLYGHGDVEGARAAWENALPHLKDQPVLYDSVRATIADLGR